MLPAFQPNCMRKFGRLIFWEGHPALSFYPLYLVRLYIHGKLPLVRYAHLTIAHHVFHFAFNGCNLMIQTDPL